MNCISKSKALLTQRNPVFYIVHFFIHLSYYAFNFFICILAISIVSLYLWVAYIHFPFFNVQSPNCIMPIRYAYLLGVHLWLHHCILILSRSPLVITTFIIRKYISSLSVGLFFQDFFFLNSIFDLRTNQIKFIIMSSKLKAKKYDGCMTT